MSVSVWLCPKSLTNPGFRQVLRRLASVASVYTRKGTAKDVPSNRVGVDNPQGWKFKKRVVWRDDDDITPFKPKPLPQAQESR